MAVKSYSLEKDGNKQLSPNFKVREFACPDSSPVILICEVLVELLQKLRDHFVAPVTVNSAYRTVAYNAKIGGATNSQHTKGTAADIVVKGVEPLVVAQYAEALGAGGIGHYPAGQGNFTHIDTRAVKYRWEQRTGKEVAVFGFGGKTFAQQIQAAAGLDNNTMAYLAQYKYAEPLLYKLAEAIYKKAGKGANSPWITDQVRESAGLDEKTMDYLWQYKYGKELLDKLAGAMK